MGIVKIGPAEGEQRQNETKGKSIIIGVFFDGTCNNMNNTDDRARNNAKYWDNKHHWYGGYADKGDDSYENDYSNVARLYNNYKNENPPTLYKIYIEGIGTTDHESDDALGYAFGTSNTGIPAKVKKACFNIANKIIKSIKWDNIKVIQTLTVDVFGFSRGAAAARHFVHEITKPNYKATKVTTKNGIYLLDEMGRPTEFQEFPHRGYLGAYTQGIEIRNLIIRFVGLFETVGSYASDGTIPSPFSDDTPDAFENDTHQLHLDAIGRPEVKRVIHLTAADEVRKFFPLTNIKSAGSKGIEKELPGVHSDLGGGYTSDKEDIKRLMQVDHFYSKYLLEDFQKELVKEGWYIEKELSIECRASSNYFQYCLRGNRNFIISKMYSFIPLYFMCEFALKYDTKRPIPFDLNKLQQKYSIAGYNFMQTIKNRLHKYVFDGGYPMKLGDSSNISVNESGQYVIKKLSAEIITEEMKETVNLMALRRYYLHQSANYDRHAARTEPMAPRIEGEKRKRERLNG